MNIQTTVPASEITDRTARLQALLRENNIGLALLRQNADLYYFSGTVQDGHLLIPAEGEPVFLVWRVFGRAVAESPLHNIQALPGLSCLPDMLKEHGLRGYDTVGLEMDVLPASLYLYYTQTLWPGIPIQDVTHLVRCVRACKSSWEIARIEQACAQVAGVVEGIPELLRPDMLELELAAEIESSLRKAGHPGYMRMHGWNQECGAGQILTGPEGATPSWTNTPGGGIGTTPAYGQSAGLRHIQPYEPISIDLGGSSNGYLCDQTRLFCIGGLPEDLVAAYQAVLELHHRLADSLVPGAVCSEIYDLAVRWMQERGYGEFFMGIPPSQVSFVGHGLGVEIDEYPFLARNNPMELAPGMVVAVEPKLALPNKGLIGIEDTYLVTRDGARRLTLSPQELVIC